MYFRFYGRMEAFYDMNWKVNDVVKVKKSVISKRKNNNMKIKHIQRIAALLVLSVSLTFCSCAGTAYRADNRQDNRDDHQENRQDNRQDRF